MITDNDNLRSISLPQLQLISGDFFIGFNDSLTTIDLPQLKTVGGDVDVYNNNLTGCDLGSYTEQYCP